MKLTDKYISKLKHLDKDQFFSQEGVEGLTLRVYKYPSKLQFGGTQRLSQSGKK